MSYTIFYVTPVFKDYVLAKHCKKRLAINAKSWQEAEKIAKKVFQDYAIVAFSMSLYPLDIERYKAIVLDKHFFGD